MFFFVGVLFIGINFATQLQLGLPEEDLVSQGSYLAEFQRQHDNLSMSGPPIFIVVKSGTDYSNATFQNQICTDLSCNADSVLIYLDEAPYISGPVYSWLDDYLIYGM